MLTPTRAAYNETACKPLSVPKLHMEQFNKRGYSTIGVYLIKRSFYMDYSERRYTMDSFIKKLGLWITAVLLIVVAGATPALAASATGWNVKLVSVQLVKNEHVGNEWYYTA